MNLSINNTQFNYRNISGKNSSPKSFTGNQCTAYHGGLLTPEQIEKLKNLKDSISLLDVGKEHSIVLAYKAMQKRLCSWMKTGKYDETRGHDLINNMLSAIGMEQIAQIKNGKIVF